VCSFYSFWFVGLIAAEAFSAMGVNAGCCFARLFNNGRVSVAACSTSPAAWLIFLPFKAQCCLANCCRTFQFGQRLDPVRLSAMVSFGK